jgi:hypothetical protein
VPEDINSDPSMKSAPDGSNPLKADKPPSPQTKRTVPDSLKPSSLKGVQGFPGAIGALTSPTHAAPGQDHAGASSVLEPTEPPRVSPPNPRSHGLGATGGSQHGEGSSMP